MVLLGSVHSGLLQPFVKRALKLCAVSLGLRFPFFYHKSSRISVLFLREKKNGENDETTLLLYKQTKITGIIDSNIAI